jgi:cobaltochelatase CobS
MAAMKGMYDPDVIRRMVQEGDAANKVDEVADKLAKLSDVKEREYVAQEGVTYKTFGELFNWKPTLVPENLPVAVFTDEDWPEEARCMIPDPNENWIWPREATEKFAAALSTNDTTLLFGLQGTGKSDLAKQWAATFRYPCWRMNCNAETREAHFTGNMGIIYDEDGNPHIRQEPTALTDSLRYGGIFIEDEAFRHSSALVLQSLREKSSRFLLLPNAVGMSADERKMLAPIGKWHYVMTDNTVGLGDETGTFQAEVQDVSTLDRIDTVIEMDYLGKTEERKILNKYAPDLNEDQVNSMLDFAKAVRLAFKKDELMSTFSVRALLNWADKISMYGDMATALKVCWFDKLSNNDKAIVKEMYMQVFASAIK